MTGTPRIEPAVAASPTGGAMARLALIVVVAAGLRVVQAARLECISRDGAFFVRFARELAIDPRLYMREESKQPGYSFALLWTERSVGRLLSGDAVLAWERSGQLVALVAGIAVVPLVYLLGRRVFDARIGLIAAGLAAVWSQAVDLSADVLSDMPHLSLYLAAMLAVLALLKSGRPAWAVLAGVCAGAAFLFRLEALGLPIASTVVLYWKPGEAQRRRVVASILLLVSFGATVAPYVAVTGTLTHKKSIPQLLESPADAAAMGRELEVAGEALKSFLECGRYALPGLAIAGVLLNGGAARRDARDYVIVLAALHVAAVYLRGRSFGEISTRYMIVPVALSLPWAALGVSEIGRRVLGHYVLRMVTGTAVVILLIGPLRHAPQHGKLPQRIVGDWIRANAATDARILVAPKLSPVAFYADRRDVWPAATVEPPAARLASIDAASPAWFVDQPERPEGNDENGLLLGLCRARANTVKSSFENGARRERVAVYAWGR